jgi:hypothetical protein
MSTTLPHPTMLAGRLTVDDLATFPDDGSRYDIVQERGIAGAPDRSCVFLTAPAAEATAATNRG